MSGDARGGSITNHIRRMRFDAGEMTQQTLADAVGVTRQTIIAIEAAKYSPSLDLAFRIAHAFGHPLEAVFTYEPPRSVASRR
jgi:putative transcriptional regulator